ncbi:CoA transferase [Microbacterium sp. A94]
MEELDAALADWTSSRTAEEVVSALQPSVPAAVVQDAADLHEDPRMAHREHFVDREHTVMGRSTCESS